MGEGYIYSRAGADETALREVIRSLRDDLAYILQARLEDIAFEVLSDDGPTAFWSEGRCFGPGAEVRWHRMKPGCYDVMVLSETPRDLDVDWVSETYKVRDRWPDDKPLRIYLWGTWQPAMKGWIEVRIPRLLPYPLAVPNPQKRYRAYVTAAEYARNGMVRFIRWKMLRTEEVGDAG